MTSYRFEVPGPPVPWQRVKRGKAGNAYVPEETRAYKLKVGMCARTAGVRMLTGPVVLTMNFYTATRRKQDGDNLQKSIQDALNGIAWEDDSQVKEWHGSITLDPEWPRAVVRIEPRESKP